MKTRYSLVAAMTLVLLGLGFGARPLEAMTELPSVLVTAGSLGEVDQELSPGAVTVIRPEEVRGEFKTLSELLDQSVGVHVIRTQGRGGYTVASVRGSTSAQVAVYVDGVLANLESEAAVDLSTIPVENVERIEVYRGHIPAAFGLSGMGAVINVVTVAPDKAGGSLLLGLGDYGEYRGALRYGTPLSGGHLLLATEFEGSDGDFPYRNDNGTPYNLNDDYDTRRQNNGWEGRNVLLKWSDDAWTARFSWQSRIRDLPLQASGNDRNGMPLPGTRMETEKTDIALGRSFRHGDLEGSVQIGRIDQDKEFFNPHNYLGQYGDLYNRYKSERDFISLSASLPLGLNHYLEFFGNLSREELRVDGDVLAKLGGRNRYSRDKLDLSFQDTITIGTSGNLLVVPTLRWNDVDGEGHLSWSLGADWLVAPSWRLKASYGRYHRAPNFYELYGDSAMVLPSSELNWEEGTQWDLGMHWEGSFGELASRIGLTYFRSDVDDLIEFIMINPRYGQYRNVSKAEIDGVELETRFIRHPWDLTLSYTYLRALNKTSDSFRYDKRLPNRPEMALHARLLYAHSDRLRLFGEVDHTGDNYLDQRETMSYSDLTVVNAGFHWNVAEDKTLTVAVNDLFDRSKEMTLVPERGGAEQLAWYPLQGRTWVVSLLWEF